MNVKYFDEAYVVEHLKMSTCIDLMEKALSDEHEGKYLQFLRTGVALPGNNRMGFMPVYGYEKYFGVKILAVFHDNYKDGFPSHQGQVMVFENTHGVLLCEADANAVTRIRTAAASGAATRALAVKNPKILTIFGTGAEAITHIEAMLSIYGSFEEIRVWNRKLEKAQKFCEDHKDMAVMTGFEDAKAAVKDADIICTVTGAPEPLFKYEWLKKGVHINAVGSCSPEKREIDSETVLNSRFFGDKNESVLKEAGDFIIPLKEGVITEKHLLGEIAEVFLGKLEGRTSDEDITVFESLGIGTEDLASAAYLYEESNK